MGSNRFRVDMPRLIEFYKQRKLHLDDWISDRIKLSEINEGFATMKAGKVVRSADFAVRRVRLVQRPPSFASSASAASSSTWAPAAQCSSVALSASLWLRPSLQGTKIMAVGVTLRQVHGVVAGAGDDVAVRVPQRLGAARAPPPRSRDGSGSAARSCSFLVSISTFSLARRSRSMAA